MRLTSYDRVNQCENDAQQSRLGRNIFPAGAHDVAPASALGGGDARTDEEGKAVTEVK